MTGSDELQTGQTTTFESTASNGNITTPSSVLVLDGKIRGDGAGNKANDNVGYGVKIDFEFVLLVSLWVRFVHSL